MAAGGGHLEEDVQPVDWNCRGCVRSSVGGLCLVPLRSLIMTGRDDLHRDMAGLVVPSAGCLQATGGRWDPYRLIDPSGEVVGPVTVYLRDLQAAGRTAATQRSYGMDLLRWFCWAIEAPWDQATHWRAVPAGQLLGSMRMAAANPAAARGRLPDEAESSSRT